MTDGPLSRYRAKITAGELAHDPMQELCAEKLQSLKHALDHYEPATGTGGWRERFGLTRRRDEPTPPLGLYIYGEVGRGKSMLMDLFYETIDIEKKRRVHFHDFMQRVHAAVAKHRNLPDGAPGIRVEWARLGSRLSVVLGSGAWGGLWEAWAVGSGAPRRR